MTEHTYRYITDDNGVLWRLVETEFNDLCTTLMEGRSFDFERAGKRMSDEIFSLNDLRGGILMAVTSRRVMKCPK